MFVANTKKQFQVFTYRLPERTQPFSRTIKPGGQIEIGNLDQDDIDYIVKQNEIYGMRPADEVSRQRGFVGIAYSIDKQVHMDTMLSTFEVNDKSLDDQADLRLERTAKAIAENMGREVGKVLGGKDSVPPQRVEIEVTEDTPDGKSIASGVEVIAQPDKVQPHRGGKLSLRR
jgi:hypothetical protein